MIAKPASRRGTLTAYLLLGNSLLAIWLTARRWEFILPQLILLGLHPLLTGRVKFKMGYLAYLLFSIPYAVCYNEYDGDIADFGGRLFPEIYFSSLYFIGIATLNLFRPTGRKHLPLILVYSGLALAGMGRDFPNTSFMGWQLSAPTLYTALVLVFGGGGLSLSRAYLQTRPFKPQKRLAVLPLTLVFFGLSLLLMMFLANLFKNHFTRLDRVFIGMIIPHSLSNSPGFSNEAKIGSISADRNGARAKQIAIRAYAKSAPGYLRGKVFVAYNKGRWFSLSASGKEFKVKKGGNYQTPVGRFPLPGRHPLSPFAKPAMMIYPAPQLRAHFFLPQNTIGIETASNFVKLYAGYTLTSKYKSTSRGYGVFTDPQEGLFDLPERIFGGGYYPINRRNTLPYYRAVNNSRKNRRNRQNSLTRRIQEIVRSLGLSPGSRPPDKTVAILAAWFASHYTYKIGWQQENRTLDPIHDFLNPPPPGQKTKFGHCELFATSGALILRQLGIPSRYVTGFVCAEKNPYDDTLYVARNKHAHAWVEYFVPERGWLLAEFTPPAGRPQIDEPKGSEAFLEYLGGLWRQISGYFKRNGPKGVLELIGIGGKWLVAKWWRIAIMGLWFLFYLYRRFLLKDGAARKNLYQPREYPARLTQMRAEYLRQQKKLRPLGLAKTEGETLREYTARLVDADFPEREQTLAFLHQFADLRYAAFE